MNVVAQLIELKFTYIVSMVSHIDSPLVDLLISKRLLLENSQEKVSLFLSVLYPSAELFSDQNTLRNSSIVKAV